MAGSLTRSLPAPPQGQVLAVVTVLAVGAAAAGRAWETVAAKGWLTALGDGLGQGWAFWLAAILAVWLAARGGSRPASRADLAVAGLSLVAAALPFTHYVGAAAPALVGAWFTWRAASGRIRGAALIVLALGVSLAWVAVAMLVLGANAQRLGGAAWRGL